MEANKQRPKQGQVWCEQKPQNNLLYARSLPEPSRYKALPWPYLMHTHKPVNIQREKTHVIVITFAALGCCPTPNDIASLKP